jgi:hypothetical protein
MTRTFAAVSFLMLVVAGAAGAASADELSDLVDRADRAYRGDTSAGVFEMEIVTKHYTRSYKVVAWDDSRDKRDKTLIKILGPALWRGNGTLKIGDKLELYDPKTNHITLVAASMLGDSWMGSHFSNDDLVKETRFADDYNVKLEKKWQADSPLGKNATFYRIQLTPKPTAPVAWAKIVYILQRSGDTVIPARADYYRKLSQKRPSRTATFSDVEKLGGRLLPATMTMTVADKPGEHTTIHYLKLALGVNIPDNKFTEQALRK